MARQTLASGLSGLKAVAAGKKVGPAVVPIKQQPSTTVMVGAHFNPEVRRALLVVRGKTGHSMRQLLGEAINDLCAKYKVAKPFSEEA